MTVRLPDSLHEVLSSRAEAEGVSMNQFVVYALSQVAALDSLRRQTEQFEALRNRESEQDAEAALKEILAERG